MIGVKEGRHGAASRPSFDTRFEYDGPGLSQKCVVLLGSQNRPVSPRKNMFQRFRNSSCCLEIYYDIKTYFFCSCVVIPNYK